jgi:subtilase family protein
MEFSMQSNNAPGTISNPLLKRMLLAAMGLAVSTAYAAPVKGTHSDTEGELIAIKVRGQESRTIQLHSPDASVSIADIADRDEPYQLLLRNKVVVRAQGMKTVRTLIASLPDSVGQVVLEGSLGDRTDAWELTTENVRTAIAVAELLSQSDQVTYAFVDSGQYADPELTIQSAWRQARNNGTGSELSRSKIAPGIQPTDPNVDPAGTSDPDLASFWHLNNLNAMFLGNDNNVTQDIYDVLGYTGAGITIGIARPGRVEHLDSAHTDIDDNYDADLTMPVDTTLFPPDRTLTSIAGIIAGERDNGIGGHGIAPNAQFASMSTGTDLLLANMLTYEQSNIDVKVIPSPAITGSNEFTTFNFASGYNDGAVNDYVGDYFRNSLRFGRNRKGSIFVFSGGFSQDFNMTSMPFYPDPYDAGGFDDLLLGNELEIIDAEEGGLFTVGPTYIRAQTYMYPFASDRLTFLINGVGEDGIADMNQAIGPSVFASVYTGTSNAMSYWDNGGTVPRGIFASIPGNGTDEIPDQTTNFMADVNQFTDVVQVNGSSAAITGGIIALMLEANPNLSVRDIQHIFFESIFESTRNQAIKFPEFDPTLQYLVPNAVRGQTGTYSFWQINAALHPLPAGGVASIRHSDQYGFGVIDAELAVTKAETWTGAPQLVALDTGRVDEDSGVGDAEETRVPLVIADAAFAELSETATMLTQSTVPSQIRICVRNNIVIESIVVELTATGSYWNEIFTFIESPYGTRSNLSYPTTRNAVGTSFAEDLFDDERDAAYNPGTLGNDQMALIRHEFTTFKHWGELSGGNWTLNFIDFAPDSENVEGEASTDMDPAMPNVHDLGVFGLPGSNYRDEKEVTAFRIRIYGYEVGEPPFLGCDPFNTSCPADINADGVVSTADFNLFLEWYFAGDIRADLNDNGIIDFFDISAYRAIFQPGFCTVGGGAPPFTGGRPRPGSNDAGDTNPPTRPI